MLQQPSYSEIDQASRAHFLKLLKQYYIYIHLKCMAEFSPINNLSSLLSFFYENYLGISYFHSFLLSSLLFKLSNLSLAFQKFLPLPHITYALLQASSPSHLLKKGIETVVYYFGHLQCSLHVFSFSGDW